MLGLDGLLLDTALFTCYPRQSFASTVVVDERVDHVSLDYFFTGRHDPERLCPISLDPFRDSTFIPDVLRGCCLLPTVTLFHCRWGIVGTSALLFRSSGLVRTMAFSRLLHTIPSLCQSRHHFGVAPDPH